jgi:hypothetical protein
MGSYVSSLRVASVLKRFELLLKYLLQQPTRYFHIIWRALLLLLSKLGRETRADPWSRPRSTTPSSPPHNGQSYQKETTKAGHRGTGPTIGSCCELPTSTANVSVQKLDELSSIRTEGYLKPAPTFPFFCSDNGIAQEPLPKTSSYSPGLHPDEDDGRSIPRGINMSILSRFSNASTSSGTLHNIPLQNLFAGIPSSERQNHSIAEPVAEILQASDDTAQMSPDGSHEEISEYIYPLMPSKIPRYERNRVIDPVDPEFLITPAQKEFTFPSYVDG